MIGLNHRNEWFETSLCFFRALKDFGIRLLCANEINFGIISTGRS